MTIVNHWQTGRVNCAMQAAAILLYACYTQTKAVKKKTEAGVCQGISWTGIDDPEVVSRWSVP